MFIIRFSFSSFQDYSRVGLRTDTPLRVWG